MLNAQRHAPRSLLAAIVLNSVSGSIDASVAQQAPPAPTVSVAEPLARRIAQWDEFTGRFQAVDSVEVRPRVSGVIDKAHFKDGQLVKSGDVLFTLDRRPFQIAVESALAEIARANAQIKLQESEVDRAAPLASSGTLTQRELDTRTSNLGVARASLLAAQAALKTAELNLDWTVVKAPINGRISDKAVNAGNLVTGGAGSPTLLSTIVSQDPIHFVFDVSESDFMRYSRMFLAGERESTREAASPVRIKLADETNWPHTGKLDFIDNQISVRSGTIRGRALIDNKSQLLQPGLFGRLQLFGGELDALLIPDAAVVSDQARKIVLVVGADNVLKAAPVVLGHIAEGLRVIRSGLKVGDRVVIDGLANPMVRPGAKIVPQRVEIKVVVN